MSERSLRDLVRAILEASADEEMDANELGARLAQSFLDQVSAAQFATYLHEHVRDRWASGAGYVVHQSSDSTVIGRLGDDIVMVANGDRQTPAKLIGFVFRSRPVPSDQLPRPAVTGDAPDEITELVADLAVEFHVPGIVVSDGTWTVAGGTFSDGSTVEVSSKLCAYSIAKTVTASVALTADADGQLRLDTTIASVLPGLSARVGSATLRQLLAHTAGVNDDHLAPYAQIQPAVGDVVDASLMAIADPGRRYSYSNLGYGIAQMMLEHACGAPLSELVGRAVSGPLELSSFTFPTVAPKPGYDPDANGELVKAPQVMATIAGGGGLWCAAQDLARFAAQWTSLLPADVVARALSDQTPDKQGQGLAWRFGPTMHGHSGGGAGFSGSVLHNRDQSRTTAVLTTRSGAPAELIAWRVLEAVGARRPA